MAGKSTLIMRINAGDFRALPDLLSMYISTIKKLAWKVDHDYTEDDIHEIVLAAMQTLKKRSGRLDGAFKDRFVTWLYRTVRNVICARKRRADRESEDVSLDEINRMAAGIEEPSKRPSASKVAAAQEFRQMVKARIARLPLQERQAMALEWSERLSDKEIAKRLNVPLKVVQRRLERAHERLYRELGGLIQPNEG